MTRRIGINGGRTILTTMAVLGGVFAAACSSSSDPNQATSKPDAGGIADARPADNSNDGDADPKSDAVATPTGHVVISQVYGGGGSADAPFTNDFVELLNAHREAVSINGWSLQYASASGMGNFGATDTQLTELPDATLQPGQYYLVQLAQGSAGATALPTPDFVDPTPINMSATGGKIALVKTAMPLGCNGGSAACTAEMLAGVVDLVGYGASNFFEGSGPAAATSTTTADFRAAGGCIDTDDNAADFAANAPVPRNTQSPRNDCTLVDAGPPRRDAALDGDRIDAPAADALSSKRIRDIQERAHTSPLVGSTVAGIPGVVTAVSATGFYMQDPSPDADDATSEGIFVYTNSAASAVVGDSVLVTATVDEFRPSCATGCTASSSGYSNLSTTELKVPTSIVVVSSCNALPAPIAIGTGSGERHPPTSIIDDDTTGNVETDSKAFDPANDGIDFYESLEGMRVAMNDAVATGPTGVFTSGSREIPIIPSNGDGAGLRTARGGILVSATDFNPERIILHRSRTRLQRSRRCRFQYPQHVTNNGGKPVLAYSPGPIDPTNAAFSASRKPLTAEFTFHGHTLFVIANHFISKGGDQPLFGRFQPPTLSSEAQRLQQTQIVGSFVSHSRHRCERAGHRARRLQ